jgi:hypothetical protein
MSRILEDFEIDDVVADAFDLVWESFDKALLLKLVQDIEIPVATEMAMMRLYKIAYWSTCAHDGKQISESIPLEQYSPDEEPEPVVIDPWARGTGKH